MSNQGTYVYQEFPKCKYHRTGITVTVNDSDAEAGLGEGWANSPAGPFLPLDSDPLKCVSKWDLSDLRPAAIEKIRVGLIEAHIGILNSGIDSDSKARNEAMQKAFDIFADEYLDLELLTEHVMAEVIPRMVYDAAVSGGWQTGTIRPNSRCTFNFGNYWVPMDVPKRLKDLFAAQVWRQHGRLIEKRSLGTGRATTISRSEALELGETAEERRQRNAGGERTTADLVVSLHGIRTRGQWQKQINSDLQSNGFRHELLDYGFFGALRLLIPPQRSRQIDWFRSEYERLVGESDAAPSLIAHSFGTYIVASALEKYPELRLDRMVFCGSIVRVDYDWQSLLTSGRVNAILNEYSASDIWAKAAAWSIADGGASGARGFQPSNIDIPGFYQRARPLFRHSDHFYPLNYRKNWIPFLSGIKPLDHPEERNPRPNWRFRITMSIVSLIVVTFALAVFSRFPARNLTKLTGVSSHAAALSDVPVVRDISVSDRSPLWGNEYLDDDEVVAIVHGGQALQAGTNERSSLIAFWSLSNGFETSWHAGKRRDGSNWRLARLPVEQAGQINWEFVVGGIECKKSFAGDVGLILVLVPDSAIGKHEHEWNEDNNGWGLKELPEERLATSTVRSFRTTPTR